MHGRTERFHPPKSSQTFGEVVTSFNRHGTSAGKRHSHMSFAQHTRFPDSSCSIHDKVACLRESSRGLDAGAREALRHGTVQVAGSPGRGLAFAPTPRSRTPSPTMSRRPRSLPTTPRVHAGHGGWQSPRRMSSTSAAGAPYAVGGAAGGASAELMARGVIGGCRHSNDVGTFGCKLGASNGTATTAATSTDGPCMGAGTGRWMAECGAADRPIPRTPPLRPGGPEPGLGVPCGDAIGNGSCLGGGCGISTSSSRHVSSSWAGAERSMAPGVGPCGGGGYGADGAWLSMSSSASRFAGEGPPVARGAAHGPRVASFIRLNSFLLRTHIASLVSALAEDGWLEVWEKERLCRYAREDSQPWAQSFLRVYARFMETEDVQAFVADLRAHLS